MTHPSQMALHSMVPGFIESYKAALYVITLISFLCGFCSICPLMNKDNTLMETPWWERLTELDLFLMSRAMLSKSLIQFSVDGWGSAPSLLFDLRQNCGGGNEDNGDLLQNIPCVYCCTHCPQPCIRPPPTHASAGDSWTLMGKSGSVSCGVTAPISWDLVYIRFCLCPPRGLFPQSCVSFGGSRVGLMETSSKSTCAIPRSAGPRAPAPAAGHC